MYAALSPGRLDARVSTNDQQTRSACPNAYTTKRLSDPDLTGFERHLVICPGCQNRVAEADRFLRAIREGLRRTDPDA